MSSTPDEELREPEGLEDEAPVRDAADSDPDAVASDVEQDHPDAVDEAPPVDEVHDDEAHDELPDAEHDDEGESAESDQSTEELAEPELLADETDEPAQEQQDDSVSPIAEVAEVAEVAEEEPARAVNEEDAEPRTRSAQLKRLLVAPSWTQIVVAVLLAVLGFAAVTQVMNTELDDTYEGRREEELIDILNGLTGTSDRARREISRLEQTRRELQIDSSARSAAVEQAEQRLQTLNVLAGLVPVTGPGLRITVTEETDRIRIDSLLDMVQELRTAGAEAMEFNGRVRVVASTSFSQVDGVIHVDGVPVRSPYVLSVIGEPHTLHAGLVFPSGPVSSLKGSGAKVAVEELDSVDITSVRELPGAQFAEPAEGQ